MGKTIKRKEVIAYKGMKSDMTCRDFQYEIGKTYKTDKAKLCECGFHACLNPTDVLEYYPQNKGSRYFKVKLSGEITKCDNLDTQVAATEITILEEITDTFNEIIETTEWWKSENVLDLLYWSDGFARVKNCERQYNFINKNGKILSEQWYEWVGIFYKGFARVRREDRLYNFIDKNGKIISNEWFKSVDYFNKDGFARVQRKDGKWNFITKDGKIISEQWFMYVFDFKDGFAVVQRRKDGLMNFIDKNGKIISDEWFNDAYSFHDGLAKVERTNGEWAKIDKNGKIVSE